MLIQFCFKNFKSFRDDTILDLSATKITENSNHVIHIGTEKILPIAAIYGANASGKSNVVDAFRFMAIYVLDSFAYGGENDDKKSRSKRLKQTPFFLIQQAKKMFRPLKYISFLLKTKEANAITMVLLWIKMAL